MVDPPPYLQPDPVFPGFSRGFPGVFPGEESCEYEYGRAGRAHSGEEGEQELDAYGDDEASADGDAYHEKDAMIHLQ